MPDADSHITADRSFWQIRPAWLLGIAIVVATSSLDLVIPPLGVPVTLLIVWGLLRASSERWRDLGLRRPDSWPRTILLALVCAAGLQAFAVFALLPLLRAAGMPMPDLSSFAGIEGNLATLAVMLIVSWTTAGFGEEVIWRGFIMGRAARLLGGSRGSWIAALIATSLIFGLLHAYQGPTGIALTGFAGLALGAIYLLSGRNLWLSIFTHALTDTSSFLMLYLGWGERIFS